MTMLRYPTFLILILSISNAIYCEQSDCGRPVVGQGNIIGGIHVPRGYFPWSVALITSPNGTFFCGGTLISNKNVLTAAHCIHQKYSSYAFLPRNIRVLAGVYDLNDKLEVGRVIAAIQSIEIHPDWNPQTKAFDADIAYLTLEDEIQFTKFIQPICLPTPGSIPTRISEGLVVGYGKSEDRSKYHENIPKVLQFPIHENSDCFLRNSNLVGLSSNRTFCGGSGNGAGACLGDSGSGLYVRHENKFYLRGIVSSSLFTFGEACDVNTFSVFTDVLQFNSWILGEKFDGNSLKIAAELTRIKMEIENRMPLRTTGVWVSWNRHKAGVPEYSVQNNYHDTEKYYVIRAYHEGNLIPGKFAVWKGDAYIGYNGNEIIKDDFDILTHTNYIWSNDTNDGLELIPGGEDRYLNKFYICRVYFNNGWSGGKLINDWCFFPYGFEERRSNLYGALKKKP